MTDNLQQRATLLGLHGLIARWDTVATEPWLPDLIAHEEQERSRRGVERRIKSAKIGPFKTMADFDWAWATAIDREAVEDLFTLDFMRDNANIVLIGPNGVGKTMIAQNLGHTAALRGFGVKFTTASAILNDLAAQDGARALQRALARYCQPALLVIDEVGYLSYDNRHADLLFEVVTRRYGQKPIIVTTNKSFSEWTQVFPNAACVVTLVDRLVHTSEIIQIEGESYRRKEALERAESRTKRRRKR